MYLKLSLRNAKRSFTDYLLYMAALTVLLGVMELSQCIAILGKASGFQTASLPVMISLIQMILISYIDRFMLKQRAKEFASYLLLGMEKNHLATLFLAEFFLIGIFCFLAGTTLGFAAFMLLGSGLLSLPSKPPFVLFAQSTFYCLLYFCLAEVLCACFLKRRICSLQIRELMYEKEKNQVNPRHPSSRKGWGTVFVFTMACLVILLQKIVSLPYEYLVIPVSIIVIPLLTGVFAFYKWLFEFLHTLRQRRPGTLPPASGVYLTAHLTANIRLAPLINAVFCLCLLFSYMSFFLGVLTLQPKIRLFDQDIQTWMGVAQVCLCIIFLVIYFFLLSLRQIMEQKLSAKDLSMLYSIGMDRRQIQALRNMQIHIGLSLPMLMAVPVILTGILFLNPKLNSILPDTMNHILLTSSGWFFFCIALFYLCCYRMIKLKSFCKN